MTLQKLLITISLALLTVAGVALAQDCANGDVRVIQLNELER